jgi:hypothetical protein
LELGRSQGRVFSVRSTDGKLGPLRYGGAKKARCKQQHGVHDLTESGMILEVV